MGMFLLGEQDKCDELNLSGSAGFKDELQLTADSSMNNTNYFTR